jgi:hypothetical protein
MPQIIPNPESLKTVHIDVSLVQSPGTAIEPPLRHVFITPSLNHAISQFLSFCELAAIQHQAIKASRAQLVLVNELYLSEGHADLLLETLHDALGYLTNEPVTEAGIRTARHLLTTTIQGVLSALWDPDSYDK